MKLFRKRRLTLAIPAPCQETWNEVPGTARDRFCEKCQHSVTDFSILTRKEAERIMKSATGSVCGHLAVDQHGSPVFRPEPAARSLVRIAGLSLAGLAGAAAQSTCELQIKVKDPMGAVVPKAPVSINPGQSGFTDSTGTFLTSVPPGSYQVDVRMPGFDTFRKNPVEVSCSNETSMVVNADLKIGGVTGSVVFIEGSPTLQPVPNTKKRKKR